MNPMIFPSTHLGDVQVVTFWGSVRNERIYSFYCVDKKGFLVGVNATDEMITSGKWSAYHSLMEKLNENL